jgi:hypothetical protein
MCYKVKSKMQAMKIGNYKAPVQQNLFLFF